MERGECGRRAELIDAAVDHLTVAEAMSEEFSLPWWRCRPDAGRWESWMLPWLR